jgi:uncharacterized protein YbaP (TraB family)
MLARVLLSMLLCALLGCAHPVPNTAPAAQHKSEPPARGLFLYRVQPAGAGRPSYLLGTIHLGFGFDEVLTPAARAAFDSAKVVITETDLTDDPASRLVQAALLPSGQSLKNLLDAKAWGALEARLAGQIPSPVLAQMKPWLPAVLLGIADLKQAFDELRPGQSERMMDVELMARAQQAQKPLQHLETVDEQIAVFEGISIEEQISELKQALERGSQDQARELVLAFDSGDEARLSRALFDDAQMKLAPGFYQAVLYARNARWLPPVERALGQGDAFIAVGAAHLLGNDGLLQQLRKRGYRVERVR